MRNYAMAFSRLRERPKDDTSSRLRDRRGETLAETLVSLLIIVTALTILAGGISTGARINKQTDANHSVVFAPPMSGDEAHFTKDDCSVSFRLSLRDEELHDKLSRRLASSDTETDANAGPSPVVTDTGVSPPPDEADTGKTVEMKPLGVKVRRVLAMDRNKSEVKWRILYVLEDVIDGVAAKGADNETDQENNQIGE